MKDFLGTKIKVGDTIIVGERIAAIIELKTMKVVQVESKRVQVESESWTGKIVKSWRRKSENMYVVPQ